MSRYIEMNYNGRDICIRAEYVDCRDGFSHTAEVWECGKDGRATARMHYLNRTWEAYPFQSVIHAALCNFVEGEYGISHIHHTRKSESKVYKSLDAACRRDDRFRPLWNARKELNDLCSLADAHATGRMVLQRADAVAAVA